MRLAILCLVLMTAVSARASLDGEWIGWGLWSFDGEGVNCNMTLSFTEKPQELIRHGGYFECNLVGMETYGAKWDWIGGELLFESQVVGAYNGTEFRLTETINETTDAHTVMTVNGNEMIYEEKWIRDDGAVIYDIYGKFKKK